MEINFWYLSVLVLTLVYIISILVIRAGIDRRTNTRRMSERRVCAQVVSVDRRLESNDRRHGSRRG